jgi:hypothetical protein
MNKRRSQGRPDAAEVERRFRPRAAALLALGLLSLLLALSFSSSTGRAEPIERDEFPSSWGMVDIDTPFGPESIMLRGPTTVEVDLGSLADTDVPPDGREQVDTEIVEMTLTGNSALLGPVIVRVPQARHPGQRSTGEIEEGANTQTGRLDVPPFDPTAGPADSFFDVFFELQLPMMGVTLHNHDPKRLEARITQKPPAPLEIYESPGYPPVQLFDDAENPWPVYIGAARHVPNAVGGTVELRAGGPAPAVDAAEGSGPSVPYAPIAAGGAAVLALAAGGWYARRRLS